MWDRTWAARARARIAERYQEAERTVHPPRSRSRRGSGAPPPPGHPPPPRARKALNAATIAEMHRAFREGGRAAILKVMKNQPAVFLKLLVLLVPRESGDDEPRRMKALSDEQLESESR